MLGAVAVTAVEVATLAVEIPKALTMAKWCEVLTETIEGMGCTGKYREAFRWES